MSNDIYQLTFLPFYKVGFLSNLNNLKLIVKDAVSDDPHDEITKEINLRGPEKVMKVDSSAIARVYPPDRSNDGEINYFPYIDFKDLDFPWRYTILDSTADTPRLDTWLCLIVLKKDEIDEMLRNEIKVFDDIKGTKILQVYTRYLPDPSKAWAFAHVQLNAFEGNTTEQINEFINNESNYTSSRLLCYRKLEPQKSYQAFLVPIHKKALVPHNLIDDSSITNRSDKAWIFNDLSTEITDDEVTVKLPIYHQWSFMTAEKGDFESLVRKLKPWKADPEKVGSKLVDSTIDNDKHFYKREGALAAPGFVEGTDPVHRRLTYKESFKDEEFKKSSDLFNFMNESLKVKKKFITTSDVIASHEEIVGEPDPLVTYPVYGRYFRQIDAIEEPTYVANKDVWPTGIPWIHEINQDLRYRLASGFGTTVIQNNQDKYLEECWEQSGAIRLANEKLRRTKSGFGVGKKLFEKHMDIENGKISIERFSFLSIPFQSNFPVDLCDEQRLSSKAALKSSGISSGVFSSTFMRIAYQRISPNVMYDPYELWAPWKKADYLAPILKYYNTDKISCTKLQETLNSWKIFLKLLFANRPNEKEFKLKGVIGRSGFLIKLETKDKEGQIISIKTKPETVKSNQNGEFNFNIYLDELEQLIKNTNTPDDLLKIYLHVSNDGLKFNTEGCVEIIFDKRSLRILNWMPKYKTITREISWLEQTNNHFQNYDTDFFNVSRDSLRIPGPKMEVIKTCKVEIEKELYPKFKPQNLKLILKDKLSNEIKFGDTDKKVNSNFDPIMVSPKINDSMYIPLKKLSLDYVLPGVGEIENNVTFLLEENRKFIESVMCGINQEMGRELVYHEYFTDQRGTVFSYFWDPITLENKSSNINEPDLVPPTDIDEIHTWNNELSRNKTKDSRGETLPANLTDNVAKMVLIIKGDVVRRYPDMNIYSLKCKSELTDTNVNDFTNAGEVEEVIEPLFRAQLGPDVLCMGFPIKRTDLKISPENPFDYYFVLQEQQDILVFGADIEISEITDDCSNLDEETILSDLSWGRIERNGNLANNKYIKNFSKTCFSCDRASNPTSSSIANVTFQLPTRIVIHAHNLVDQDDL